VTPSFTLATVRLARIIRPAVLASILALVAFAAPVSASASASALPGAHVSATSFVPAATYPGIQHLHYKYGPIPITPGQNTIEIRPNKLKPKVPGYITRFKPNLIYADSGKVPRVDVIHLHHGVWLVNGYPTFAAGEEKTITNFPQGYGFHTQPSDNWLMNYMIHNLTPTPTSVYIVYDIDFLPDSAPAAAQMTPAKPLWMDVAGIKAYPVFDALKGEGKNGRFTFPDQARPSQLKDVGPAHQYIAPGDMTLIGTAGHLHPGGLYDDLRDTRAGTTKLLFRSIAKYFEPAGAVSWDVSMTATKPDWRVAVHSGDKLSVATTYDTSQASWYESMGIMIVWYADGIQTAAKDPFTTQIDNRGILTHGHLPENDNHGGGVFPLPDARTMLNGISTNGVSIKGFLYGAGDLNGVGKAGRPPVIKAGQSLTFTNLDGLQTLNPSQQAYHTITACRAPCNRSTGIAYPIANGTVQFDSKELGYGPSGLTPASNTNKWSTPKNLKPGTYTFFCRIHPFMRGAFRVIKS
jgi:plastocyanin